MTGPRTSFPEPGARVPAPRRPTHQSLVAFADLVDAAISDARRVLAESAVPGEEGRRPGAGPGLGGRGA